MMARGHAEALMPMVAEVMAEAALTYGDKRVRYAAAIALIRDHADFLSAGDKEQILVKTAEDFFFKR